MIFVYNFIMLSFERFSGKDVRRLESNGTWTIILKNLCLIGWINQVSFIQKPLLHVYRNRTLFPPFKKPKNWTVFRDVIEQHSIHQIRSG